MYVSMLFSLPSCMRSVVMFWGSGTLSKYQMSLVPNSVRASLQKTQPKLWSPWADVRQQPLETITSRVDSSEAQRMFDCTSFEHQLILCLTPVQACSTRCDTRWFVPPIILIALSMCTYSKVHLIYILMHVHLLKGAYIPWMQFVLTVEHAIRA